MLCPPGRSKASSILLTKNAIPYPYMSRIKLNAAVVVQRSGVDFSRRHALDIDFFP